MEIIIQKNHLVASLAAADLVAKTLARKPDAVIGLASGETPMRLYEILVEWENQNRIDFTSTTFFSLDEYVGLDGQDPASYFHYFESKFFGRLKKRPQKIFRPEGQTKDVEAFCQQYEDQIRNCGGIDLQILGLGRDGHLAFNEPGSSLSSRTRIKTLTQETLRANRKLLCGLKTLPTHVLTMGIGTIMEAKRCVVLAFGEKKSRAVAGMAEGPITASLPASILQMHAEVHVCLDAAAASLLKRKKYYQFVYAHKPEWQR